MENGEVEIEGRTIYAGINTYTTEPKADRRPEKHNKYIDVQDGTSTKKIVDLIFSENISEYSEILTDDEAVYSVLGDYINKNYLDAKADLEYRHFNVKLIFVVLIQTSP